MRSIREVALLILEALQDYKFHHKSTGSEAHVIHRPDGKTAVVSDLHTPEHHRGMGGATKVLKDVTSHLDRHHRVGELVPVATSGDDDRLKRLYRRHGFRELPNRRMMVRDPT